MDSSLNTSQINNLSRTSNTSPSLKTQLMSLIRKSNKIFVGEYLERRLVRKHPYTSYKDIIVIDKNENLIKSLKEIHRYIYHQFEGQKSLGITRTIVDDEIQDYKLWVDLTDQIPLGKHWFQIRSIKVEDNTVQLQLKHLRPFENPSRIFNTSDNHSPFDINEILTYHNLIETLKFCAVVLMSLITLAGNFLWYFADYSIKITRELSNLIRELTPIFFGFYDFASKCVASLLWLIYILFRGDSIKSSTAPAPSPRPLAIMPDSYPLQNYQS
ncbi:uncharacterized protein [Chelonus insularis]|uniref:uncharacterized protein n=1 Tax=Chelonus insularis TaxID=460826 RepID=UPI0015896E32|nr:uncharacterized protein LOC118072945 [Chelonus insularis]